MGSAAVVHSATSPGAKVTVDGQDAPGDRNGSFPGEAARSPGENTVEVVAFDSRCNSETIVLLIASLGLPPQPFMLLVTEPAYQSIVFNETIRISARTGPEAVVSVNGVRVPVDPLGIFSTLVTLEAGANIVDVLATNRDGQVLSAVIATIFRP